MINVLSVQANVICESNMSLSMCEEESPFSRSLFIRPTVDFIAEFAGKFTQKQQQYWNSVHAPNLCVCAMRKYDLDFSE